MTYYNTQYEVWDGKTHGQSQRNRGHDFEGLMVDAGLRLMPVADPGRIIFFLFCHLATRSGCTPRETIGKKGSRSS
jgi:hypothetical protein